MKIAIRGKRKHDKYRVHVMVWQMPNWFERLFFFQRERTREYVGKGTVWFEMRINKNPLPGQPLFDYQRIQSKSLIEILRPENP